MSALTFSLKTTLQQRVDCSPLIPDNLAGKSIADIAAIELSWGNRMLRVDSLFEISGSDTNHIEFKNSNRKLDYIGSHMRSGSITIHGGAGSYLGLQMSNGVIVLHGDADAFAASGMSGGLLHIHGDAGDFLAAAIVGDRKGMHGGIVIVTGNVGDRAGDQLRRGIVLIEGNAGSYCASRMLAGTIAVLGTVGDFAAYGMQRGTLVLTQQPRLHVTIQDCGIHTLPFLSLMFKSFSKLPTKFAQMNKNRVQRFAGDIANDGKGEILVLL
ncbi:MAG TPA: formylmethanofuran dehydrogenase subunit C [Methylophilaceae bacterium]|jgi:formylmethanofuran dehydrogenase subunit C